MCACLYHKLYIIQHIFYTFYTFSRITSDSYRHTHIHLKLEALKPSEAMASVHSTRSANQGQVLIYRTVQGLGIAAVKCTGNPEKPISRVGS